MASDGTAHAASEAHDASTAVADGGDAVEGAFYACAVVPAEISKGGFGMIEIFFCDGSLTEVLATTAAEEACLGAAAQIEDYFEQLCAAGVGCDRGADVLGEDLKECVQIVADDDGAVLFRKAVVAGAIGESVKGRGAREEGASAGGEGDAGGGDLTREGAAGTESAGREWKG